MSKIADKLIEVEQLIIDGHDTATVARLAAVPVEWVINTELEMRGMNDYGQGDDYDEASFD